MNLYPYNYQIASTYEIHKNVKSLETTNSYGYDEIPKKILQTRAHFIISPLIYVCNKSLSSDD